MNEQAAVAILMGSKSDKPSMEKCSRMLDHFGIPYNEFILSAHRNPNQTAEFAENAEANGYKIIIAAAGMAAHLAGVIAGHSTLPVIGVPMPGSALNGVDALYATVQMPSGVPVATVAIGSAGAANSAVLAAQILALSNPDLKAKLREFKEQGCRI
ncbi:5-(carboxyamino)imidazole ribonucleotide mutase [bacterium]|nr:5-(carboxyamino)imidazole ribonucleotide mutase [bacterium]